MQYDKSFHFSQEYQPGSLWEYLMSVRPVSKWQKIVFFVHDKERSIFEYEYPQNSKKWKQAVLPIQAYLATFQNTVGHSHCAVRLTVRPERATKDKSLRAATGASRQAQGTSSDHLKDLLTDLKTLEKKYDKFARKK